MTAIAASGPTSCSAGFARVRSSGLKVSRKTTASASPTLREILNRLAAEGFVLAEGSRGFEVAPISVENLRDLAELRLLLESHAMQVSFANADVEWEGRVVSAHHKLASTERLMETGLGELEQWKRYDGEFHQALISNCGSRALMEMHALVFDKYFRYQMVAFSYRGSEPAAQHRTLLDSALKRDAETATATLRAHVQQLRRARARDGGAALDRRTSPANNSSFGKHAEQHLDTATAGGRR